MSWKPLLSPALRTTLQKIAAAYGVSVDALIDAALQRRPDSAPGAELAAKALSPETLAELRAIPRPEEPPHEVLPVLPDLAAHELLDLAPPAPVPPDVVITVDGVHLTCPCVLTHAELRERIAVDIPHMVADETRPLDLHLRRDGWSAPVSGKLTLCDGDVILTHADPAQAQAVAEHLSILAALLDTDIAALIDATLRMTTVPVQPARPTKVLLNFSLRERFTSLEGAMQTVAAGVSRAYATRYGKWQVYSAKVESFRIAPAGGYAVAIRCWLAVEVDASQLGVATPEPGTEGVLADELNTRDLAWAAARTGDPITGWLPRADGVWVDLAKLPLFEAKTLLDTSVHLPRDKPPEGAPAEPPPVA